MLLVGIESGGLAVLGAVVLIPVYLAGQNAQGIMLAAMSPMTGQSFLLIIMATLLGLTPSNSGAFRRRRAGGNPDTHISIRPVSVTSAPSPSSRFSTGSFINPKFSSSYPPTSPTESKHSKAFLNTTPKTAEPRLAYTDSRYSRGYVHGEPLPFSTAFIQHEPSIVNSSRESLPSGEVDSFHISVSSLQEVDTIPESTEPGTLPLGKGADVVVSEKYVS